MRHVHRTSPQAALERTRKGLESGVPASKYMAAVDRVKALKKNLAAAEGAVAEASRLREELGKAQAQLSTLQVHVPAVLAGASSEVLSPHLFGGLPTRRTPLGATVELLTCLFLPRCSPQTWHSRRRHERQGSVTRLRRAPGSNVWRARCAAGWRRALRRPALLASTGPRGLATQPQQSVFNALSRSCSYCHRLLSWSGRWASVTRSWRRWPRSSTPSGRRWAQFDNGSD